MRAGMVGPAAAGVGSLHPAGGVAGRAARRPAPRAIGSVQPNSLFAVSAIVRPWKRAPSRSIALGWRWPWPPAIVVAP